MAIQQQAFGGMVSLKKLSWAEHVLAGHTPFRKDCRVCQEACAKDHYHRRSKLPARCGVLSMDISGPFRAAPDIFRGTEAKYLLVGTFTWPDRCQDGSPEKLPEDPGCPEEAPIIDDFEAAEEERLRRERIAKDEPEKKGRGRPRKKREGEELEGVRVEIPEGYEENVEEEDEEKREEVKVTTQRMLVPLATRNHKEVLKAVIDFYLRLRADGYLVTQLHTTSVESSPPQHCKSGAPRERSSIDTHQVTPLNPRSNPA